MKFLFAIVLSVLVAVVMCEKNNTETEADKWTAYKAHHEKQYDGVEDAKRFEIYQRSVAEVEAHNKKHAEGLETYTKALNQFSDWTPEESAAFQGVIQP
ncbi:unnamed protein product [Diamesa hyperborea]